MAHVPLLHAFLACAREFDKATTHDDKFDAVCGMLTGLSGLRSKAHMPVGDTDKFITEGLQGLLPKTQKIAGILQYALMGRDYFKTQPVIYMAVVKNLVTDYVRDDTDPDIFAATNLALYMLTADLCGVDPQALSATVMYANALHNCRQDNHFARHCHGDETSNGKKALNLLRICAFSARRNHTDHRITSDDLLGVLVQKYQFIAAHEGQEALIADMQKDAADPVLRDLQKTLDHELRPSGLGALRA